MNNNLKTAVILSYITIFLGLLISLIYTPFMLRTIGESQYGLYSLVASVVGYLGLINFGFSSSYIRYYSKYKVKNDYAEINKLNGMFLLIFITLSLTIIALGFLLVPNLHFILGAKIVTQEIELAKTLFVVMLFNLSLPLLTTPFSVFIIAHERFIFMKIISLIKTVLTPLFMVIVLILGYETIGMSTVLLIITVVFELVIVAYAIFKLNMHFSFSNFDIKLMKEMTIFSSFIFISMVTDQVNWSVDKFLLGRYQGTIAVAVYSIASQINGYYLMFSTQVSSVFTPRVNNIVANGNDKRQLTDLFTRIGRLQFFILGLILIGFYGFGERFIILWAGEGYRESYYVILILISTVTIPLIQNTGIEIQRAMNMHKYRSVVYLFIAFGNILISIPLIQKYGPVGAAIGTGVALLFGNGLIMNWYYNKYIGLNIRYFWYNIIQIATVMIVPLIVVMSIKKYMNLCNIYVYLCSIFIYILVYSSAIWFFAMTKVEKDLLTKPLNQICNKIRKKKGIYDRNY